MRFWNSGGPLKLMRKREAAPTPLNLLPPCRSAPPALSKPRIQPAIGGRLSPQPYPEPCRAWATQKGPAFFENLQGIQTIEVLWWVLAQRTPPLTVLAGASRPALPACSPALLLVIVAVCRWSSGGAL